MNATTVRIIECTSPTELYRRYDGESEAQPAYLELDLREGTLLADYDVEIGNARPESVVHGLVRRYTIPILTGDAANRIMTEIAPLTLRILDDSTVERDGSTTVGRLGADALAAEEEIESMLGLHPNPARNSQAFDDADFVAEWDIASATDGSEVDEYGITADTTDARLEEIAAQIHQDMAACGDSAVVVIPGLDEYLRERRDELVPPMSDAGFRVAREHLGLTGEALADHLRVSSRTVRHWEQGKYAIPTGVVQALRVLQARTDAFVAEQVADLADVEDPEMATYRTDDDYRAAEPGTDLPASWHRAAVGRIAQQVPGLAISYAETEVSA